jgi:hypothetical protein
MNKNLEKIIKNGNFDVDVDLIDKKVTEVVKLLPKYEEEIYELIINAIRTEIGEVEEQKSFWGKIKNNKKGVWEFLYDQYEVRDKISQIFGIFFPKYYFEQLDSGFLGEYNQSRVDEIVKQLNHEGYHIFENKLSSSICNKILASLDKVEFQGKLSDDIINGIDVKKSKSNTYWVLRHQDIIEIPEIQEIASDPTILNVVQDYLKCAPIQTQSNCWWSTNNSTDKKEISSSAQMFHQDFTFVKFIKVFIYLNNVGPQNGPHVYVPGSTHLKNSDLPKNYKASQRISDKDIFEKFENVKEMVGEQGTILFEDTTGFHKGKPVETGHRVIFQLEYCCSVFDGKVTQIGKDQIIKITEKFSPKFKEFIKKYPRIFNSCINQ